jgi:asparagine synthase (glutamine-hydrolysing)
MCGIVAILSASTLFNKHIEIARSMLNKIIHRGPDGDGLINVDSRAIFGHCRLAIIDPEHGAQPMRAFDDRYSLVFNGEIYNYLELREKLIQQGDQFSTNSDTEVLLKLLVRQGENAIKLLNGMFAFIFHDSKTNRWIAARDHFGIKPLYYTKSRDNELVFSSEIKALLVHPGVKTSTDKTALNQYLALQFCLDSRTMFSNICKIKPGFYLVGTGPSIQKEICYWDVHYKVDWAHNEEWFSQELHLILDNALKLQTRSDVPVGAYLSGGIDSSLIYAFASQQNIKPIPSFHGRFAEGPQYDESSYAKEVVKKFNGEYFEIVPTAANFVEYLPRLIEFLDEPLAGPGLFPQFMVSKLAREHVKVVLGGQGGDEIFGGYARYLVGYLEQALKGAIFETQEEGNHLVTLESIVPHLALLKQYQPLLSNFWSKGLFDEMDMRYFHLIDRSQGMSEYLHPDILTEFDRNELFEQFQKVFNHPDTKSYLNKMTHFDQKTLLPALLQIEDRVSMSVSLESRVPLLDYRIVNLVTSMPPAVKFSGGRMKHILKKASKDLLPSAILERKDKMGFPVPLVEWMKGGIVRDFVGDTLLSQRSLQRGIYKPQALRSMLENQGVGGRQLWGALSLELWHQIYIDA